MSTLLRNCFWIVIILSYILFKGIKLDKFQIGFRSFSELRSMSCSYIIIYSFSKPSSSPPSGHSSIFRKILAVKTRFSFSFRPLPLLGSFDVFHLLKTLALWSFDFSLKILEIWSSSAIPTQHLKLFITYNCWTWKISCLWSQTFILLFLPQNLFFSFAWPSVASLHY